MNMYEGSRVIVGDAGGTSKKANFYAESVTYYPGGTTKRPENIPAIIETSANSLPDEPDGSKFTGFGQMWYG